MISYDEVIAFCNSKNYDLRESGNGRWIDQKCTPDVLWSVSDFVLNYVDEVSSTFTPRDIWNSEYAKLTIADTFSKPGTDEKTAENEYDKVFAQPLSMLCYAGIIKDTSSTSRHLYQIENREVLEFIARNDLYALKFIQAYNEKVLTDSGLMSFFIEFFEIQDDTYYERLKSHFIDFYHTYTKVKKDYEPKRIFTKVLNPLALKYSKRGTERGRISEYKIVRADLMYNRDNFRDIYMNKPKGISREEWKAQQPALDIRPGYFVQMMNSSKRVLKSLVKDYRGNISELTMFSDNHDDKEEPTQIHHIFPKSDFPTIMHYLENLIALTPNQHFTFAHPSNNTSIVDYMAQRDLLLAKTSSIKFNIETQTETTIFDFENLITVLKEGWKTDLEIDDGDYIEVIKSINNHYC